MVIMVGQASGNGAYIDEKKHIYRRKDRGHIIKMQLCINETVMEG